MIPIESVSLRISLLAIVAFITPLIYHSNKRKRLETGHRRKFFQAALDYAVQLRQFDF